MLQVLSQTISQYISVPINVKTYIVLKLFITQLTVF